MSLLHLYLTNSRVTNCDTFLTGNSIKNRICICLNVSLKIVSLNFLKFSRCLLDISTNQPQHFCKTWALFTQQKLEFKGIVNFTDNVPWQTWYATMLVKVTLSSVKLICDLPCHCKRIPQRYGDIFLFAAFCELRKFLFLERGGDLNIQSRVKQGFWVPDTQLLPTQETSRLTMCLESSTPVWSTGVGPSDDNLSILVPGSHLKAKKSFGNVQKCSQECSLSQKKALDCDFHLSFRLRGLFAMQSHSTHWKDTPFLSSTNYLILKR